MKYVFSVLSFYLKRRKGEKQESIGTLAKPSLFFSLFFGHFLSLALILAFFAAVLLYTATAPFLESLLSYLFPFSSIKL